MNLPYWEYFLSIEQDLEKCSKYLDFSEDNYSSYSIEFAKIIMISSAEIDTIAKDLCKEISPASHPDNINKYKEIILEEYPKFTILEAEVQRRTLNFKPWNNWESQTPEWWKDYNDIKHNRTHNFKKATLKNAFLSVSGLLIMILYYYDKKYESKKRLIDAFTAPRLLSLIDKNQSSFQNGGVYWSYILP